MGITQGEIVFVGNDVNDLECLGWVGTGVAVADAHPVAKAAADWVLVSNGGAGAVREVFVDSYELMGELPFTSDFLTQFEARAGYDLTPHLPLLFRKGGESKYGEMIDLFGRNGGALYASPAPEQAERIREDYESVRRALFEERFVERFVRWAHRRGAQSVHVEAARRAEDFWRALGFRGDGPDLEWIP